MQWIVIVATLPEKAFEQYHEQNEDNHNYQRHQDQTDKDHCRCGIYSMHIAHTHTHTHTQHSTVKLDVNIARECYFDLVIE